jgi:plastocyanin
MTYTIFPYWDDLRTDSAGMGIFTSISGTAPNRIFNIEWRATYFSGGGTANFELRLYEGLPSNSSRFDVIYGTVTQGNTSATGGVQRNATAGNNTQDFCNGSGGAATGSKTYTLPVSCASVTPATATRTSTVTVTRTSTVLPTATRTSTTPASPTPGCTPMNAQVNIQGSAFVPQTLTIPVGSTVQWTNLDAIAHTSTSAGNWDSGTLNQNQSFSHTFNSPGTFQYVCSFHPNMTGTINVTVPCTPTVTATIAPPTATVGCAPFNAQVNIDSFAFQPQNLTISVGSTVQWTNLDQVGHDTYSEGNWASPLLNQGESFSFTFTSVGTYNYICVPHPFMTGTITVIGGCTPTATNTPVPVPTTCSIQFSDVPVGHTFYSNVRCLACRGVISGYADGTFRPNNPVTRGQLAKMVSNAAGFSEDPNPQIFADVPPTHTFYAFINRLTRRGHMSGYTCGGPGEPCINNMPYFRPFANATRGQTSKIVSNAAGFTEMHTGQTFEDVPPSHIFYQEIERLASRGVMGGYPCGGPGEPCIAPENRPYFRPQNDVTRGQSAKIVANTFYPDCVTP